MHRTYIKIIGILILGFWTSLQAQHINGLTMVATPKSFHKDPYPRIVKSGSNWACLVPYGFCRKGTTEIRFNVKRQWWGETEQGVIENIKLAKESNIKVFLKPQVYVPGSWPGGIDFEKEEDWLEWEKYYRKFILFYAELAEGHDVEMLCIGTEFKISEQKRPQFWEGLIDEIRSIYSGELTYSANWDSYEDLSFWSELDYIGISAYFPLIDDKTPKVYDLIKAWRPIKKKLKKCSKKFKKPILFTEYGYLSVDGTAYNNWEKEKIIHSLEVNEQAQANALEALYNTFWTESYWKGGFIWKWFPLGEGHEGYVDKDYTPQDKKAEEVLKRWFLPEAEKTNK